VSPEPIRTPGVFAVEPADGPYQGPHRGDGAESRLQTAHVRQDDDPEATLRPRRLDEFVGQEALRDQLGVSIAAASKRGEALDHVLLAGPPGLGKTSLAQIVAAELDVPFVQTAGPALERKADIAAFLTALEPRTVFFVDEIHRMPRAVEETFYPAMEDRQLPITVGAGAGARVVTLDLPAFTLVGATTRAGLLTTPLRDRFGIQHRLDHYGPADLARIVARSARVLDIEIEPAGARAIAERARGTPRVANRLLKRVRDYAEVRGAGVIDAQAASAALDLLEVDHEGLDRLDREILGAICRQFGGGPVGLSTLAVAVQEEADTIEDVYEPYLLQRGYLLRTPRGRCATPHAFHHLGMRPPESPPQLFG
jgi:holliday junction DNA helicase RuvB